MIKIKIRPAVFPIAEINKHLDLEKLFIRKTPFTLSEFEKKNTKNIGAYIGNNSKISNLNVLTPIKINR